MARFSTLQPSSLVEEAYREIRTAILGGDLKPGSALFEAAIAREMGVSRGPVREALRLLEQAGLVIREPNKGYRLASFKEEDLLELASLRLALESLAIREAIGHPEAALRLRAVWAEMQKATRKGDRARAIGLDREFHETLVLLSGHKRLLSVWGLLRDQIELAVAEVSLTYPTLAGRATSHVPLLEAVERGDLAEALAALESHIYDSPIFHVVREERRRVEGAGPDSRGVGAR